ncbi:Sulfate/thiosulfate import ATP-binding protein CysA [Thalassovita gelatinovora]|uniref:Sulfate/thiosulfate import ATP-binding protein CysA n=1 Tax=Thalassovita gelatinovora TaxID=53501 RepID=A0A0P1G3W6_THAGE|nr:ABC transporter ATP-binding protein [Thalassovita gelatinovora]CUH67488.1 Sulfate/thiosulfate import ATP-binding protein CysA [Thalassovita gelatinovora]SEP73081.1 putative spermidine/putrescine transport system ATP-binding protein [Thalassovita gelatinovora]
MLTLSRVSRRYGETTALDGLDFVVPENTYMSLLGASGSGKTTLLRLIAGFEEPDQGEISIHGERIDGQPPHLRDIGFVFQNFALFPHLTVAQNVAYGLRHRAIAPVTNEKEITERTEESLALVGLSGFGHRAISAISGGQRQRVALARTMICEPRVILLDEPLGALDANLRARMCDELKAIRERLKVSFLHVTGSETEALTMGDKVAVLSGGKIVQSDAPDTLFSSPSNVDAARHLNAWNIFEAGLCGAAMGQGTIAVRFDQIDVSPKGKAPDGHPWLSAKYLTGEFNGPTALSFFRADDGTLLQVIDHLSQPRLPDMVEGQSYDLHFAPDAARQFHGAA